MSIDLCFVLLKSQVQSARALQERPPFVLAKGGKTAFAGTGADVAAPHRSPVLLGQQGTAPKLATLRHGRLFGPAALRCSAPFTARKIKGQSQSQSQSQSGGSLQSPAVSATKFEYLDKGDLACARRWISRRNSQPQPQPQPMLLLQLQLLQTLLIFQRLKASRAPEPDWAVEAPVSERSEFGRRARSGEARREPAAGRLVSAPAVLLPFAKTKGSRASARKLCTSLQRKRQNMGVNAHA